MKPAVEKKYAVTRGRNLPLPWALAPALVYLKLDLLGPCALALMPLGIAEVPLGTPVLLDWKRNFSVTSKQTKGNSQAGVSFPWSTCSLWASRSLRART